MGDDPSRINEPIEAKGETPEPFLRRILETPGEHVEVALTPDGEYDLVAFFDDEE